MSPSIEFIEDVVVETANGREKIAKGTVQHDVKEASAARWERRGKAKRIASTIERAAAPVPPAPLAPPSPEDLAKAEAAARAKQDDGAGNVGGFTPGTHEEQGTAPAKTAATPYVPGVDIGEGEGKTETADKPGTAAPNKNQRGRPTGGRNADPLG